MERLDKGLADSLKKLKQDKQKEMLHINISHDKERLSTGQTDQELVKYLSYFYEKPASLLDYTPADTLLLLDEVSRIHEMEDQLQKKRIYDKSARGRENSARHSFILQLSGAYERKRRPAIYYSLFLRHVQHTSPQNIVNVTSRQMQSFHGQMNVLAGEMERFKKSNFTVVF